MFLVKLLLAACGVNGALYTLIACVTGCACCYSCFYRSKMRQQHMLKKSPCGDCLVHCFCEYCALCQEYRELKTRGYDLSIGNTTNETNSPLKDQFYNYIFFSVIPIPDGLSVGVCWNYVCRVAWKYGKAESWSGYDSSAAGGGIRHEQMK